MIFNGKSKEGGRVPSELNGGEIGSWRGENSGVSSAGCQKKTKVEVNMQY